MKSWGGKMIAKEENFEADVNIEEITEKTGLKNIKGTGNTNQNQKLFKLFKNCRKGFEANLGEVVITSLKWRLRFLF